MRRRVLLMISSMHGGGSEQQTLLLLRHLDRAQFEPHLYLTAREGDLLERVPGDVPIHAYSDSPPPSGWYFPGRAIRDQTRFLGKLLQRESIDVVYDRTFHMTLIAGPAAGRCGVPRVSTIVSPPELALPMVESRFVWLKRKRLARYYRRAHRVIAVSQQAAESAERYYRLPGGSVEVIRNPVDRQQVEQSAGQFAPKRDNSLTFACVGRMTGEKGHHDLITAVAMAETNWPTDLPPLCVWLIGDGPRRGELEAHWGAINRGLHRIEFLGKQTNPAPYIKMADALILPSHFEGMPNVVLEAMALGTPVIATRVGGTIELQRDKPTIYWTQPQQAESLTRAILEFAGDRQAAQQRVQAASKMIAEYHDVTACVARIQTRLLQACRSSEHDDPSDSIRSNFS